MKGDRRVFHWHVKGLLVNSIGSDVSDVYRADARYMPVEWWGSVKEAPTGSPVVIDINDDGTSIFTTPASMPTGSTASLKRQIADNPAPIEKGSVLTLDLDSVGSGHSGSDLTAELTCEEL